MNLVSGTATFVIPYYSTNARISGSFLQKAINSIFIQTDDNWNIVIIDDSSPDKGVAALLNELKHKMPGKIHVLKNNSRKGAGESRNIGVKWAYNNESPIILFLDADDVAHPRRLEVVRNKMREDNLISVVYSTFKVIDESDNEVAFDKLSGTLKQILEGHNNPPEGFNAWIDIGTSIGYTNLTSATNVRTEIALKYPFTKDLVSEDSYTWFLYSAGGGKFAFARDIFSLYRLRTVQDQVITATALSLGKKTFCETLCKVDSKGFLKAVDLAVNNGKIRRQDTDELIIRFYWRLSKLMIRENYPELAEIQLESAKKINFTLFEKIVHQK